LRISNPHYALSLSTENRLNYDIAAQVSKSFNRFLSILDHDSFGDGIAKLGHDV
jgi:hypothetical protein